MEIDEYNKILLINARQRRSDVIEFCQAQVKSCDEAEALLKARVDGCLTVDDITGNTIQRGTVYLITFGGKQIASRSIMAWNYLLPLLSNPGRSFKPLELQQFVNAPPTNGAKISAAKDMMAGYDDNGESKLRETKTGQGTNISKLHAQSFNDLLKIRTLASDQLQKAQADGKKNDIEFFEDQLEASEKEILARKAGKGQDLGEKDRAHTNAYSLIKKHYSNIMDNLTTSHPLLCRHFNLYLKVGKTCLYDPEPRIYWKIN